MTDAFLAYFPAVVMWLSVVAMMALGGAVYFYGLDYIVRRFLRRHPWMTTSLAIVTTYYGGAKVVSLIKRLNFPRTDPDVQYIVDAGSYVTNDYAFVSFSTVALPTDAQILVAYAPPEATNESQVVTVADLTLYEWLVQYPGESGAQVAARLEWDVAWGDKATDYDWYCYTTWTPAPSVHTNGVLNCYGIRIDGLGGVLKRSLLIVNGRIVSPDGILGDFEDSRDAVLNAEKYDGEERPPYELEEYFDIDR